MGVGGGLGYREWTTAPQPALPGCLPLLASIGAIVAYWQDAPWWVTAALTAVALLGWGTCLTSLVSVVVGVLVVWEYWGTWWLVGGVALVLFGFSSTPPVFSMDTSPTPLDAGPPPGPDGTDETDWTDDQKSDPS